MVNFVEFKNGECCTFNVVIVTSFICFHYSKEIKLSPSSFNSSTPSEFFEGAFFNILIPMGYLVVLSYTIF